MKITLRQLRQVIKEELNLIQESEDKADLFSRSIGKKVMGSGYPGATIAGPPSMSPDGKMFVPVKTSGSEPDLIPIEKLTIADSDPDSVDPHYGYPKTVGYTDPKGEEQAIVVNSLDDMNDILDLLDAQDIPYSVD